MFEGFNGEDSVTGGFVIYGGNGNAPGTLAGYAPLGAITDVGF